MTDRNTLKEPSSGLAVGKYFRVASIDADGHAVLECCDAPTAPVQSVSASGTAITPDVNGNVDIPSTTATGGFGLAKVNDNLNGGISQYNSPNVASYHKTLILKNVTNFTNRRNIGDSGYGAVTTSNFDAAVKAAMCDGNGAAWTDAERLAALARMGCTVESDGTVKFTAQQA